MSESFAAPSPHREDYEVERIRDDQRRLFEDVAQLREARAGQAVVNAELKADVEKLTTAVTALTSAIDKSRGALWVISGVSGAAGAVVSWIAGALFHKSGG